MSKKDKISSNNTEKVYILGAGGMAREVLEMYRSVHRIKEVGGFVVNTKNQIKKVKNKKVYIDNDIPIKNGSPYFIGAIGNPLRKKWIETLIKRGAKFDNIIHPSAVIGNNVRYGTGNIICASSVLTEDINISDHVIINVGVTMNHDCNVGSYVTISPGVNIAGRVSIGEGTFVGIGVVIKERIKIGYNVFIGAGAVIVNDIPDNVLVYGNPAKIIKKINKANFSDLI